jgi:hypothetical protein
VVGALCWVVVLLIVFGSRFPCVFCGACGVREILGFLKMWRYRLWLFVEMCLICYIFECGAHSPGSMSFADFLLSCSFLSSD